jgi:serine/threonine protein kinase
MMCLSREQIELLTCGRIEPATAETLWQHLGDCAACRSRFEEYRRGVVLAGDGAGTAAGTYDSATLESPDAGQPAFAAPPPDSFAGYQIVKEIHRGGQGVVYQAIQKSTKRRVAIKVMKEGPLASAAERARFEREVEILGQLNHPNIVTVHDSGEAAGHFYYVMDYISGQALDAWMADVSPAAPGGRPNVASAPRGGHPDVASDAPVGRPVGAPAGRLRPLDETLRLFQKICEAVNAAHLRGVIHRDLKPGNIRIDPQGEPHILDFGLAKVTHGTEQASLMTLTGQFMGSLPWASPEQAEAVPSKIDIRTDVYSLGVILYQMLTGRFPYEVAGNMRDVLDRIMHAEPDRPSSVPSAAHVASAPRGRRSSRRGRIDDELDTIVLKCLAKERERRYQSAGELARDMAHYLKGEPIKAKRDSALYLVRKLLRRYRGHVAVGASFIAMLALSLAVSITRWRQAAAERDRAVAAELVAEVERSQAAAQRHRALTAEALAETERSRAGMAESARDEEHRRYQALVMRAGTLAISLSDGGAEAAVPQTAASDDGGDFFSRARCARRWKVEYPDMGCDVYGPLLVDIGVDEIGALNAGRLILVDLRSGISKEASVVGEDRVFWVGEGQSDACGTRLLREAAGFDALKIIWFMSASRETEIQRLEMDYVETNKIDIAKVGQTILTPEFSDSGWKLRIQRMD